MPQLGLAAQQRLARARVVSIGAGGVKSSMLYYLAAVGVGHLTIIDFDLVELSNLNRQILYTEADLGRNKAEAARDRLRQLNNEITIDAIDARVRRTTSTTFSAATRSSSKAVTPSRAGYCAATTASAPARRWSTLAPSTATATSSPRCSAKPPASSAPSPTCLQATAAASPCSGSLPASLEASARVKSSSSSPAPANRSPTATSLSACSLDGTTSSPHPETKPVQPVGTQSWR